MGGRHETNHTDDNGDGPAGDRRSAKPPSRTGRDARFVAYENQTVKDQVTGLMWAAQDNGGPISCNQAKLYCKNYRGGGYDDWRMPTTEELKDYL
jgi:hypothetical protein